MYNVFFLQIFSKAICLFICQNNYCFALVSYALHCCSAIRKSSKIPTIFPKREAPKFDSQFLAVIENILSAPLSHMKLGSAPS